MASVAKAKGTGEKVVYQASFDKMWSVLPGLVKVIGLELVKEDRPDQMILARRGMTGNSYGEDVAIFVEKIDDQKTQVEIVSKKVMTTNFFAPDWAKHIFKELDVMFKRA